MKAGFAIIVLGACITVFEHLSTGMSPQVNLIRCPIADSDRQLAAVSATATATPPPALTEKGEDCDAVFRQSQNPIEVPTDQTAELLRFESALKHVLPRTQVNYKIAGLDVNAYATEASARRIIDQLFDPTTPLSLQMKAHTESIGGKELKNKALWNLYFTSYDQVVARTSYRDVFLRASRALSPTGTIADFGAGSGNGSTLLKLLAPARHMLLLDHSADGLEIARKKLTFISDPTSAAGASSFDLIETDLTQIHLAPQSLDGAIMNNVLYTLGDKKAEVLETIFTALKPGGTLILSDPVDFVRNDPQNLKNFVTRVATDAIKNGAPLTQYDVALVGAINFQKLMGAQSVFLSPAQLRDLAEHAGFTVSNTYSAYYGAATFLILNKPK